MSYKQIDEQFMKKFEYISCGYHCSQPDFDDLKSFLHQIYSQAKAEGYQAAIEDMSEDKAYKENKLYLKKGNDGNSKKHK